MIPAPAWLCQLCKENIIHVYGECGLAIQVGCRGGIAAPCRCKLVPPGFDSAVPFSGGLLSWACPVLLWRERSFFLHPDCAQSGVQ
jgi:hypothetical protein